MYSRIAGTGGSGGGSRPSGLPPKEVTNIIVAPGDTKIKIRWTDPEDITLPDGTMVAKWSGTKIVYKEGSFPENRFDGIQILDSKERNKYSKISYEITGLENEKTYFISLFPYTDTGLYNNDISQRASAKPTSTKYYGVRVDKNDSNPETRCVYLGDAEGMKPGDFQNTWRKSEIFKDIKPCAIDGTTKVVNYYLQKDNITRKENGEKAELDCSEGFIMTEFPKMGYKFVNNTDSYEVWLTRGENIPGYCYKPFSQDEEGDCDKLYIACFLWSKNSYNGVCYPSGVYDKISNRYSTVAPFTPSGFSSQDTNEYPYYKNCKNGKLLSFYQLTLLQILFLLMYKTTDFKKITGGGRNMDSNTPFRTGVCKYEPECYYDNTNATSSLRFAKFLNIEDIVFNKSPYEGTWVDGIASKRYGESISTGYRNNTTPLNMEKTDIITKYTNKNAYMVDIVGNNDGGFLRAVDNRDDIGSASTYFCCNPFYNWSGSQCAFYNDNLLRLNIKEQSDRYYGAYARLILLHKEGE